MFGLGENDHNGKWEKEKREKYNLSLFGWNEKWEKKNRVDEVFHLKIMNSSFFSFQIGGKKREKMVLRKKV